MDLSHTDFFVSVHSFSHIGLALVAWNNYFLKGTGMDNEMDVMRIFLVGGFKYFFMFAPYLGKWSQFDEHFFQWGLKPPTSDVMRIFALLLHRISRKHPGLDSVFFSGTWRAVGPTRKATNWLPKKDGFCNSTSLFRLFWWGLVCPLKQIFHSKTARNNWKTVEEGGVFKLQFFSTPQKKWEKKR